MTGLPELKCTNGRNQNVEDKRSRTNDCRRKPEERHRRDITRCASVTDRRIEKRNQSDCEKQKNEMRRVHVLSCRAESRYLLQQSCRYAIQNGQRFLDFARNDKSGDAQHFLDR